MIKKVFWDKVKKYIDAKTMNLSTSMVATLDAYDWDLFESWKTAGFPSGAGWDSGTYDPLTGVVTFTSSQELGFITDDLRGAPGEPSVILGSDTIATILAKDPSDLGATWLATDDDPTAGVPGFIGDGYVAYGSYWANVGQVRGPKGTTGDTGDAGINGTNGTNGDDGTNGINGTNGTDGAQGVQGPIGLTGPSGTGINLLGSDTVANILAKTVSEVGDSWTATDTGVDSEGTAVAIDDILRAIDTASPSTFVNIGDLQGPQGSPGADGANGTNGAPGADGTNGTNGTNGTDGIDGVDGAKGDTGAVGPTGPQPGLVNSLTSDSITLALTGAQGKVLDGKILPKVGSVTTGVTGADQVTNCMSLTQAEYDAISPDGSTIYYIVEAP